MSQIKKIECKIAWIWLRIVYALVVFGPNDFCLFSNDLKKRKKERNLATKQRRRPTWKQYQICVKNVVEKLEGRQSRYGRPRWNLPCIIKSKFPKKCSFHFNKMNFSACLLKWYEGTYWAIWLYQVKCTDFV